MEGRPWNVFVSSDVRLRLTLNAGRALGGGVIDVGFRHLFQNVAFFVIDGLDYRFMVDL